MAVEALFTGFMHIVQIAPIAAVIALLIGAVVLAKLRSVYFSILTFFVSFGVGLAVL
jgi:hypothetical protein